MLNNILIFPTQISIEENVLTHQQCHDIHSYYKNKVLNSHGSIEGDGYSSHSHYSNILIDIEQNINSCSTIKTILSNTLNNAAFQHGLNPLKINNSWINIQNDSSLKNHRHPHSILSAALYTHVDKDSSSLYFYNPNPYRDFTSYSRIADGNHKVCEYKPTIGSIVIFPSWLKHGSNNIINKTEQRSVISMNTIWE